MASYPKEMTDPTRRSTVIGLNGEEKLNWFTASIKEALSLHYKNGPYPFLAIVTSVEASDPDCEGLVKMTEDYQDEIRKSIMKNPKLMPRGIRIVILNEQNQHKCQDSNKTTPTIVIGDWSCFIPQDPDEERCSCLYTGLNTVLINLPRNASKKDVIALATVFYKPQSPAIMKSCYSDILNNKTMWLQQQMSWDNFEAFFVCLAPYSEPRKDKRQAAVRAALDNLPPTSRAVVIGSNSTDLSFLSQSYQEKGGISFHPVHDAATLFNSNQKRILFTTVDKLSEIDILTVNKFVNFDVMGERIIIQSIRTPAWENRGVVVPRTVKVPVDRFMAYYFPE